MNKSPSCFRRESCRYYTVSTVNGFSVRCEAIFIWSRLHSNTQFVFTGLLDSLPCLFFLAKSHYESCMMLHEKWCWHGSITYNYHIWYRIVLLEFESSERPEGSLEEFPFIFFLSTKTMDQRFKRCFQRQRHWCLRNLVGGTSYPISRKCQMFCLKVPFRSPLIIIRKTHHVFHVFHILHLPGSFVLYFCGLASNPPWSVIH